jgi:hypothetical protein
MSYYLKHPTCFALCCLFISTSTQAETIKGAHQYGGEVIPVSINKNLRQLSPPHHAQIGAAIKETAQRQAPPKGWTPPLSSGPTFIEDPLLAKQRQAETYSTLGSNLFDTQLVNIEGLGFTNVNPSDTVGDVGNRYYIQMVNGGPSSDVLIIDKRNGNVEANFTLSALAEGSTTSCSSGSGDPVVVFDESVDNGPGEPNGRWLLSEFTSFSFCVYISATADPIEGGWHLYEFPSVSSLRPDYPKYAVWHDAYYIGANEDFIFVPEDGSTLYALDRDNMLQGQTTRPIQVFEIADLPGFFFQLVQPADWDGSTPPPAGSPAVFLRHNDDEIHNPSGNDSTQDFIELFQFALDWDTPSNSGVTGPIAIPVSEFESELCGTSSQGCVPQPGSAELLDPLAEPMMWRNQYRNFGSHESIIGSYVVDTLGGNANQHGIRWFELRKQGAGNWTLHQEGTYAPDNSHRFIPSLAMDISGNIAMGFNVSNATDVFPGIRYTGRRFLDDLGTMPRGEHSMVEGQSANGFFRYGDYASMSVDPVDGCTFWYASQYNPQSQWSTRIASFRFDQCGAPSFNFFPDTTVLNACTSEGDASLSLNIGIDAYNGFNDNIQMGISPAFPPAVNASFSPNPASASGSTTLTLDINANNVAAGNYPFAITGNSTGVSFDLSYDVELNVFTQEPFPTDITSPSNNAINTQVQPLLLWDAVPQVQHYRIDIATDASFSNIVYSREVQSDSHRVDTALAHGQAFFWRVVGVNTCAEVASETLSFTTRPAPGDCPVTHSTNSLFNDDVETGSNGWSTTSSDSFQWSISTARANSGSSSWFAAVDIMTSEQSLISPSVTLPGIESLPIALSFYTWQDMQFSDINMICFDGGLLEISTDDGNSWTQLDDELLTLPYDANVITEPPFDPNPLAGLRAWCANPRDWTRSLVSLDEYAGETVRFRFRLGSDSSDTTEGWYIDDIEVQACSFDTLFEDGFEQ